MSSHGWFDSEALPLPVFDKLLDPLAWFDRDLLGFDEPKRISQSFLSWFDKSVVCLALFDPLMDPIAWFGDDGGPDNFPVLTAADLSLFFAAPYAGTPWSNFASAGSSTTKALVSSGSVAVPTVGATVNGYASAYFQALFDPATLNLSGWWRADFAGAPWAANASAGSSIANGDLTANNGTVNAGATQNGHAPADFDGTSDLRNLADVTSFATTTAGTFVALFEADTAAVPSGNIYDDPAIIVDGNGDTGLTFTTSGFTGFFYDGAYQSKSVAAATGAYHLVMMRWDGVNLGMTIDSSSEVTQACGTSASFSGNINVGIGYGLGRIDGRILELMVSPVTLTPSDYANIKSYCNIVYGLSL